MHQALYEGICGGVGVPDPPLNRSYIDDWLLKKVIEEFHGVAA